MEDQYVAVSRTWFVDGTTESQEIMRGSRPECRQSAAYSAAFVPTPPVIDGKKVDRASVRVMPAADWDSSPVRW